MEELSFLETFKLNLRLMIQRSKFSLLLQHRVTEDSPAGEYLKSRGLSTDFECYDFEGTFNYRGKDYQLPQCIVVPMRNRIGQLQGVWIRFLQEKRFYIWLVQGGDETIQKFWLDIQSDDAEDEPVYLAESIFDALSLRELFGFKNVGAVLGIAASAEMQEALKDYEVVMCFDRDSAGYKGMLAHLNNPRTQHWKILEISSNLVDISGIKDYNDIIKQVKLGNKDGLSYKIKSSIQAKIYIKSKL